MTTKIGLDRWLPFFSERKLGNIDERLKRIIRPNQVLPMWPVLQVPGYLRRTWDLRPCQQAAIDQ